MTDSPTNASLLPQPGHLYVVATPIVTDAETRAYYNAHPDDFATPEKVHVRHIVITDIASGPGQKTKEEALARIENAASEIRAAPSACSIRRASKS